MWDRVHRHPVPHAAHGPQVGPPWFQGITKGRFSVPKRKSIWGLEGRRKGRKVNANIVYECLRMSHVPQKPGHRTHTCAKLRGSAHVQLIQLQGDALWDRQRLAFCQEDFQGWSPWWWFSWGDELLQRKLIRISNSMEVGSMPILGLNSRAFHFEISSGPAPKSRHGYNDHQ